MTPGRVHSIRAAIAACALAFAAAGSGTGCPLDRIDAALESGLSAMKPIERDVTDIDSAEGGQWLVYREPDGRVHTIVRVDYGESGRSERRLSVVDRRTYGISVTRLDYSRHVAGEGPFAIVRRTTDYYFYCDGKPFLMPSGQSFLGQEYAKAAAEEKDVILKAKDVAEFTAGLAK